MENRNELLTVRELTVEYLSGGERVHAVNDVSFSLRRGHTLALVGETGAGKTTIAKSILRILPEPQGRLVKGQIFLEGQDLLALPEKEMLRIRGHRISMIFQDPMTALNPVKRVGDQIAESVHLHTGKSKAEACRVACKMLETVGIPGERAVEYPHQFSGGMKQRVVIAMALACNPTLLLADEPTTALDVTIQAQVLDVIRELRDRSGMSMILITHDLGIVAGICDDVAVVYAGQIVEYGTKEDIFDHPMHPYTRGLFGSLPDLETEVERLSPVPGNTPDPTHMPEGCHFHPRCASCCDLCQQKQPEILEVTPGHFVRCCNLKGGC